MEYKNSRIIRHLCMITAIYQRSENAPQWLLFSVSPFTPAHPNAARIDNDGTIGTRNLAYASAPKDSKVKYAIMKTVNQRK